MRGGSRDLLTDAEKQSDVDWVRTHVDSKAPKLSESDKQRAAEFGARVFTGNMGIGQAAKIGIEHVTRKDG